ncbi:TIM barrel protein (plasmid) [Limimaricola variabilis]|uniref:hydroxypyruvate isomerase family protein n=1 Tax=Limimaricola variabilis TaxID=1492771 RepID=UPI002AC91EA5|nr:TIM barrel protein [Limimaricola variabilis]WPY96150.1 TIM barrel protein [Limimaricola variabilis]
MFSANLGMLFTDRDLPGAIRAARNHGFGAVECHWPYGVAAEAVCAALDETGMEMVSINTVPGERAGGDFGLAALPGRELEARAAIRQAVDYAARIGARHVHVMAGRSTDHEAAEAVFRENLRYGCDLAGPQGVGLLIEPINRRDVAGYHLAHIEQAAATVAAVGSDCLRIMFDCYHLQIMQGDLIRRFEAHREMVGHVQIAGVPDRHEPDGGEVHYANLVKALRRLGWDGPIGAEYRPRSGRTEDGLGWLAAFQGERA